MRAIVLLSGGLDSYTAAAMVKAQGFALDALTVQYGQRHAREIAAARRVAAALGVDKHLELSLDLRGIGGAGVARDGPGARGPGPGGARGPLRSVPPTKHHFLSLATRVAGG